MSRHLFFEIPNRPSLHVSGDLVQAAHAGQSQGRSVAALAHPRETAGEAGVADLALRNARSAVELGTLDDLDNPVVAAFFCRVFGGIG